MFIFGALLFLDFPKPGLDDLFFVGTSLNLAQGGDYSNPLLERQQFSSHFYFVHTPTYSFALAGWLKIFGVSTFSLLGFQLLMYLLICGAVMAILRRSGASVIVEWLVPLGVAAAFLPEGLRPEPASVALTMCGFALIRCGGIGVVSVFSGFFLMILGASIAERLSLFSGALLVAAIFDLRKQGVTPIRSAMLAGSAMLIVCIMLMDFIGFKLGEFWHTFHFCAAGRLDSGALASITGYFRSLSVIQWPLVLLGIACLALLPRLWKNELARISIFLLGAFLATAFIGALGHGAIWYVILMLLVTSAAGVKQISTKWSLTLPWLVAVALLIANSRNVIYAAGIVSGKIRSDKGNRLAETRATRATREHQVLIDSETARYVFDYRIPQNFLDWNFSSTFPGTLPTDDGMHPGDIYLIGPDSVDWLNLKTHLNLEMPKWAPLGSKKSFHEFPQWAYLIRPEYCDGLKSP